MQTVLLIVPVLLPLLFGGLIAVLRSKDRKTAVLLTAAALVLEAGFVTALCCLKEAELFLFSMTEELTVRLRMDGVSRVFLLISAWGFLLAGISGGKVVTLASGGKAFTYLDCAAGATSLPASSSYARLYTDKNDGGILHAVMLRDSSAMPRSGVSTAEALRGESVVNFHMTNAFRVYHGLTPFRWSEAAAEASRLHSQDMADQDYFDHSSLDGRSPWARMEAQGIRWSSAAENICAGYSNGVEAYDGWVNSAGHRSNMLGDCQQLGVGAGYNEGNDFGWYMTQDFFTP